MGSRTERDELGAHVSVAGGIHRAPERAAGLGSRVLQMFTKAPARWADPVLDQASVEAFHAERTRWGIDSTAVHDSYLINLATHDRALYRRSLLAFKTELERSVRLGVDFIVTHPGHATDGNRDRALEQNARAVAEALSTAAGPIQVLFETTAGSGNALGASFQELAKLIELIPTPLRPRVGVCLDTCHVWAAGYDLRDHYDDVFSEFGDAVGHDRLRFFHLNDSLGELGSRRDRHMDIGKGQLGRGPFERLVNDDRFTTVPKVLETPKGDDPPKGDKANLRRLRRWRRSHT